MMVAQWSDPGWRSEAETRAKSEWRDEQKAMTSNLDAQVALRFESLAVHDAPHRRMATLAEAEASTFAVVRPWFDQILATAPMQLTVIGDIDEDAAIALLRPYLASIGTIGRSSWFSGRTDFDRHSTDGFWRTSFLCSGHRSSCPHPHRLADGGLLRHFTHSPFRLTGPGHW
jgi:hypothetical protein